LEKLQKSSSQVAFLNSITEGIKLQSQHRQQRNKKASNETDTPNPSAPSTPTPLQNDSNSQSAFHAPNSQSQPSTPLQGLGSHLQPNRAGSPVSQPVPGGSQSSTHVKPPKRQKSVQNSENESASSSMEASGGHDTATEGEGPSEAPLDEIELVFKPHPTEMTGDNSLIKALKENSVRYIKTTANATGMSLFIYHIMSHPILKTVSLGFTCLFMIRMHITSHIHFFHNLRLSFSVKIY